MRASKRFPSNSRAWTVCSAALRRCPIQTRGISPQTALCAVPAADGRSIWEGHWGAAGPATAARLQRPAERALAPVRAASSTGMTDNGWSKRGASDNVPRARQGQPGPEGPEDQCLLAPGGTRGIPSGCRGLLAAPRLLSGASQARPDRRRHRHHGSPSGPGFAAPGWCAPWPRGSAQVVALVRPRPS